jgi:hypothetical protein
VLESVNATEARQLLGLATDISFVLAGGDAPDGGGMVSRA